MKIAAIISTFILVHSATITYAQALENNSSNSISNSVAQNQILTISSMFTGEDVSLSNQSIIDYYHKHNTIDVAVISIFNVQSSFDYAFTQKLVKEDDIAGYFENSMKYCALLPLWEREPFLGDVYKNMKSILDEENVYVRAVNSNIESLSKRMERSQENAFPRTIIENEKKVYGELQLARLRYAKEIITGGELFYDEEYCDYQIRTLTRFNVYSGSSEALLMKDMIRELLERKKHSVSTENHADVSIKLNHP